MSQPTDLKKTARSKNPAAQTLIDFKADILAEWEKNVRRKIPAASELTHPILIDTVPSFIENLVQALSDDYPRQMATDSASLAQEHGNERARISRYTPDHLILEYQILRDTVTLTLEAHITLKSEDQSILQKSFDASVCEAMMAYFLSHSRIREQFVAALTHDLRNPLSAAKMASEMILLTLNSEVKPEALADLNAYANRALLNIKRVDRLIQDLLDANLLQMGERLTLKVSETEILSLIKETLNDFSRKDQVRIHLKGSPCFGYWDPNLLRRAMENLISNAIKYGDTNTPIKIEIYCAHERLIMAVNNQGEPIPIEEQPLLFQKFRRAHAAKKSDKTGWGMGLAFVRGVAEAHGGSILVDSSLETGTTFTLDIPVDARPFAAADIAD